jgi:hypothetical protein
MSSFSDSFLILSNTVSHYDSVNLDTVHYLGYGILKFKRPIPEIGLRNGILEQVDLHAGVVTLLGTHKLSMKNLALFLFDIYS